jgi:hypothetical protein
MFDRRTQGDRRLVFRGGRRAADLARAGAVPLAFAAALAVPAAHSRVPADAGASATRAAVPHVRFGVPIEALPGAAASGVPMNFGVFWAGSWMQKYGWDYAEASLAAAKSGRVTPVVHWWYWGDDISPACVARGCQDRRQGVWKDRATWYRMTRELGSVIRTTMRGAETIVILETEFNKGGIESWEPFDGYLLDQIVELHRIPGVKVVIGFGNWGLNNWPRFNRAAAAADLVGTQLLRSSVRDASTYRQAVDTLVAGAAHLKKTFRKPSLIIDLALSSYPSPKYETYQASAVRELFTRIDELKALGVTGIVLRAIADDPKFDTSNYHGIAERHWGFIRADGSKKPSFKPLLEGIRREALN